MSPARKRAAAHTVQEQDHAHDEHCTAQQSAQPRAPSIALSTATLGAWCLCSGARMFFNKALYHTGYRYPFAVTGMCQAFVLVVACVLVRTRMFSFRRFPSWRAYTTASLPAAGASVVTLYTGNVGVMLLPVTFVQIVKGFTPSVTLALAVLARTERLSPKLVATVASISLGSALSCAQQRRLPSFSLAVFAFQVAACVSEAVRAIAIKRLQGSRSTGLNLAETLIALALPSAAMLLLFSAATERPDAWMQLPQLLTKDAHLMFGTAALSMLTDLTCYLALSVTSSLTFKVAGIAKNVATMLIGVAMGEQLTGLQMLGYSVATGATLAYSALRAQPAQQGRVSMRSKAGKTE